MDRICAGIVTYNPDINRLKENICSVNNQVEKIFISDNGSDNVSEIYNLIKKLGYNIELEKNDANKGIAYALNRLVKMANGCKYDWILTLDQDTVVNENLIEKYKQFLHIANVGLICCKLKDRNYNFSIGKEFTSEFREVKKCITSGTLTNVKKTIEIGGFDNKLFIDSVDDDLCYTMKEFGYKTIQINYVGILHEIGKSKAVYIGKYGFAVNNHNAIRKYYITRNSIYMIKKHNLNPIVEYFYVYRRIFTVLFFENQKKEKIRAMFKGIRDGKSM